MSFFSNNLLAGANQSNNQGVPAAAGGASQNQNPRVTMSSAGKSMASNFKWSINNRALAPAFVGENKENGPNASHEEIANGRSYIPNPNAFGARSLVVQRGEQRNLTEYGAVIVNDGS